MAYAVVVLICGALSEHHTSGFAWGHAVELVILIIICLEFIVHSVLIYHKLMDVWHVADALLILITMALFVADVLIEDMDASAVLRIRALPRMALVGLLVKEVTGLR